jgi:Outer membrane protein beta-barrel domain
MITTRSVPFAALVSLLLLPEAVAAQATDIRPAPAVEFTGGYAGFADEGTIDHGMVAAAVRYHLTPRISVGPEIQYMIGPDSDRDLILTGNLTFDVLPPGRKVTPFLVAGGGLFRHSNDFGGRSFSATEGAFTGGGGVRAWVSDRVYVASEFRVGWELHYRISGTVGVALR